MISIIHPSRQRPNMAAQTANNWLKSAKNRSDIEYILSIDDDDPMAREYLLSAVVGVKVEVNRNASAIDAINNAAKAATGNIIIVVSDDFDCPDGWDVELLKHLEGKEDFVVKTEDGAQPWIITLPIMDRKYYERFGYIYYPGYKHMFCDTEMTHVGDLLDRKITIPMTFPHNHYTTGKMAKDAINTKNDSTWAQGEALYLQRMQKNFDLVNPPGKLNAHPSHISWLQSKGYGS